MNCLQVRHFDGNELAPINRYQSAFNAVILRIKLLRYIVQQSDLLRDV